MKNSPVQLHRVMEEILLCIVLFLNGCMNLSTALKRTETSPQVPVLDYYRWVRMLPDTDIKQESEKLLRQQNIDPVIQQVQLAVLLSTPKNASAEQNANAVTALDQALESFEVSPDRIKQDYQQFALIWRDILEQRRQSGREIKDMTARIKEIISNLKDVRYKVRILQEQNKMLLDQIEALKSIEQQINEREIPQKRQ